MDDPITAVLPLLDGWRHDAARRRLGTPVFLGLSAQSPHARAAHLALTGVEPEPEGDGDGETVHYRTVSKSSASLVLALFAGEGGRSLHRLVARREGSPDYWIVVLLRRGILAQSVLDERGTRFEIEGYGSLPAPSAPPEDDTVTLQARYVGGGILYFRGPSHAEAIRTMQLVERVLGRPIVEGVDLTAPGIADEDLALILLDEYLEEPDVVAEAIRSLRSLPGTKGEGLLRILRSRTELHVLSGRASTRLARF